MHLTLELLKSHHFPLTRVATKRISNRCAHLSSLRDPSTYKEMNEKVVPSVLALCDVYEEEGIPVGDTHAAATPAEVINYMFKNGRLRVEVYGPVLHGAVSFS